MPSIQELYPVFVATILVAFMFKFKNALVYYTKYMCFLFVVGSCSLLYLPFLMLRPKNVDNLRICAIYCRFASKLIGLKWILRNTELLTEEKAYIIVSNHQSCLDILGMFMLWSYMRKCTAIARKELFYLWPFGFSAWLSGLIYIPRGRNAEKSKQIMEETGEMIKKKKIKLWIFPEGKRFSDGVLHPFKKGAFHLAIKSQIPILPIVFSYYYPVDHQKKWFKSGCTIGTALPPIPTEGKSLDDLEILMQETHQKMSIVFEEINKESMEMNDV